MLGFSAVPGAEGVGEPSAGVASVDTAETVVPPPESTIPSLANRRPDAYHLAAG